MGDKLKELLEVINVFGEKSASADTLTRSDVVGIYEGAMGELGKSQNELGKLHGSGADNPYFVELLNQSPDFYDWAKKIDPRAVAAQKYWRYPSSDRREEAKQDTSYYKQSIMDSLVQAYGFDKLK